jgi:hypothetical protein
VGGGGGVGGGGRQYCTNVQWFHVQTYVPAVQTLTLLACQIPFLCSKKPLYANIDNFYEKSKGLTIFLKIF